MNFLSGPAASLRPRDLAATADRRTLAFAFARPAHLRVEAVSRDLTFILRLGNHFVHIFAIYAFMCIQGFLCI